MPPWRLTIAGLTLEVRPTSAGGLGLYPEHAMNLPWLERQLAADGRQPTAVLNLFAHTGLASLVAARAGASVVHVDGAATAVAWARRNAELSGLDDRPIRWLVDDVGGFVARDGRRGRRYDGIVLDPPSFGHAARRAWRLEDDLPDLLAACAAIATPNAFVLLTAHTEGLGPRVLATMLETAFPGPRGGVETVPLEIAAVSGASLALGWAARRGSSASGGS
jgi:23S rRNA (cytosine1962-C5)-methyltransferase